MTLDELLTIQPDTEITVVNEPFTYSGRLTFELDGGEARHWLFNTVGEMLAISPTDEEILFFRVLDEAVEPSNNAVLLGGREYEFSYEDAGMVVDLVGTADSMEEDRYALADYESDDGMIVRIVTNENTGERQAYRGGAVVEEEILAVE